MNRKEWIETVLREIRFTPDRRKIRQELLEHMEDRMEEYMEWEKAERPRLGRCKPMLRAEEGVAPSAGDGWNQFGPQS